MCVRCGSTNPGNLPLVFKDKSWRCGPCNRQMYDLINTVAWKGQWRDA